MAAKVSEGFVLAPILYSLYTRISDTSAAPETHLAMFTDDTCIYAQKIKVKVEVTLRLVVYCHKFVFAPNPLRLTTRIF
jgi:hypothetical protein